MYKNTVNGQTVTALFPGNVDEVNDMNGRKNHKYTFKVIEFECTGPNDYNLVVGVHPSNKVTMFGILCDLFVTTMVVLFFMYVVVVFLTDGYRYSYGHNHFYPHRYRCCGGYRPARRVVFRG